MAYFAWIEQKRGLFLNHEKDFFDACDHIRQELLVNEEMKSSLSDFNEVETYIKTHYLGSDGKLRTPIEKAPDLQKLIEVKAKRIHETTGSTDANKNWLQAETYTKMFYENIIPAVVKNDREKVLRVLKAFQYSKMNRFIIINCFETASAIYFLNPETIRSLWNESANKTVPESTVESMVNVDSWPQVFTVSEPCKKRFWFDKGKIGFNGVMLDIEKKALLKALRKVEFGKPKREHVEAIEKLYDQSRLIREETTL